MAEVDNSALFQLLGSVAADVREMKTRLGGVEARMPTIDELKYEVSSLRQTMTQYHSSVLGHGVLISELEDRVRRMERHLNLPPAAAE